MRYPTVVFPLLIAIMGCERFDEVEARAHGAALLAPFKQDMKTALVAGLERGPVDAISVCSEQAPAIARSLSVDGVAMGRSSHRLRNPDNAAPDWVAKLIDAYLAADEERAPRAVMLADGRVGYVEAIEVAPPCVVCHGEALAPDIAAEIKEHYPQDRATGFTVGDFRGVFWVEFPADALR